MPHVMIDYSANLEPDVDVASLCETLRATLATLPTVPLAGIRVRALRVDHYAIADGNPAHGFIDISVRMRAGRPPELRQDVAHRLFDAARRLLDPVMTRRPLALSLELRDIDPALAPKTGSIRTFLETPQ